MAIDYRETLKADAKREEEREETRTIMEEWLDTELRRFVRAMNMTSDAYDAIREMVVEQAHDERVI